MIRNVRIHNFKGHAETALDIGRLTVLVGDNASGKTSVLEALHLMSRMADGPVQVLSGDWYPPEFVRRGSEGGITLEMDGLTRAKWEIRIDLAADAPSLENPSPGWSVGLTGKREISLNGTAKARDGSGTTGPGWDAIAQTLGRAGVYHLLPTKIAAPAHSDEADVAIEEDGTNTAVVLAAMKLGDDENFARVEAAARTLIPIIERIRIQRAPLSRRDSKIGNRIHFDFRGTPNVPAHGASHGTLVVVSLLTILHSKNRPNLILLDDLDHALHPRAQMELMRLLNDLISKPEFADLQIVATTHSPYIVDQLDPSDVYAFALRDNGTVAAKKLSEHPAAAESKGKLAAGQLWSLDPERVWVLQGEK
jgi:predicted ATPase